MSATGTAAGVIEGLREHGRRWAATRECASAVAEVLRAGSADDVMAVLGKLRLYRVVGEARRAVARHHTAAQARPLRARPLRGRELQVSLVRWAQREGEALELAGERIAVQLEAFGRWVALMGDDPRRVVMSLRLAGLVAGLEGADLDRLGGALVLHVPPDLRTAGRAASGAA